jgi:hypothetical protein
MRNRRGRLIFGLALCFFCMGSGARVDTLI